MYINIVSMCNVLEKKINQNFGKSLKYYAKNPDFIFKKML